MAVAPFASAASRASPGPAHPRVPAAVSAYDTLVLGDAPVAFWDVSSRTGSETDLTGNGHGGTYTGGTPAAAVMPDGSPANDFNGVNQYLSIPSSAAFSIPTTGTLTWEAWIRPDTLQFPDNLSGYVDYLGKCMGYSPTCEWEARMYNQVNKAKRPSRLSAYAFNDTAGLGAGAYWQQATNFITAGEWLHVVGEYTTLSTPSQCPSGAPGQISIWVDGVPWNPASHYPTGCMSQYKITPTATSSPLTIGTVSLDSWFAGPVAKVAVYDHLLTQAQITGHYQAMTGKAPTGSCASTCTF
jgi:hypothetical protein